MKPTTNPARRRLTFSSLDQVMPEVDRLLGGYKAIGNWSLGQMCSHLTQAITGSIGGFPVQAPWLLRKTLGPIIIRGILKQGKMREGVQLPEALRPKPGLDDRAEAEALRAAVRIFASHHGLMAEHPLGVKLSHADWERLHCVHCAHHLSFAIPERAG
jgi:hypothetical protein